MLCKSRKANTAFKLSHSHDDYEVHSVMDTDSGGKLKIPMLTQIFLHLADVDLF